MSLRGWVGLTLLALLVAPPDAAADPTAVYVTVDAIVMQANATIDGGSVWYDGDCVVIDATKVPPEFEVREDCPQS